MRLVSIVGARPQFVKLAPVARAAAAAGHEHLIVHTGQHYDHAMSEAFFTELDIPTPDVQLDHGGGTHGQQTGTMLAALDPVLTDADPDWVLVYGDTNSTLAGTLSATKLHRRVAHIEAGLRSHNRRMPEEANRVLVDHAADLLLAPTPVAMAHLAAEGLTARSVLVGDVMVDSLEHTRERVGERAPAELADLALPRGGYYLATIHRAESTDDPARLAAVLTALAALPLPVVLPVHPRLHERAGAAGLRLDAGSLRPVPPLGYGAMVAAVVGSAGVVTDSGGLQKEAFLLRVPCTTVRTETEWVETVDLGWNVLVEPGPDLARAVGRAVPAPTAAAPYGTVGAAGRVIAAVEAAG